MKTKIGSAIYFLFSCVAIAITLIGVFESAIESSTPASGLASAIGGGVLYLIGRDIRRVLREE